MPEVKWLDKPQDHDYPAAGDYLASIADPQAVTALTDKLRAGSIVHKKAKDILRAARLPLLPVDNPHVASDLAKIKKAKQLSPILLLRGDFPAGIPLQIAGVTNPIAPWQAVPSGKFSVTTCCPSIPGAHWPAHRPLGSINRLKKQVYEASSNFRHEKNNMPRLEPTDIAELPE